MSKRSKATAGNYTPSPKVAGPEKNHSLSEEAAAEAYRRADEWARNPDREYGASSEPEE
jgi:hypothetical protein